MYKSILCLLLIVNSFSSIAQPDIQWKKAYGGTGGEGYGTATYPRLDIQQTSDGGYVYIGSTGSTDGDVTSNKGGGDIWVVKTDNTGTIQWQKTYGGSGADVGCSINQTTDGGFIAAGYSYSNDGDVSGNQGQNDFWVFKLDNAGTITWQKSLGGSSFDEFVSSVLQAADGGYVVTGFTYSTNGDVTGSHGLDMWVVKLTSAGAIDWQKCYGGTSAEAPGSIARTKDGGYILAGNAGSATGDITSIHGGGDGWLVKLSSTGTIQWQKTYGGTKADNFSMAQQTADGGYIVSGTALSKDIDITSTHDSTELWVLKTDSTGGITWSKTFGGSLSDAGYSVMQATDGNYVVSGVTTSNNGDVSGLHGTFPDIWLLALYPDGNLRWKKTIGSNGFETTSKIIQTTDGGFALIGVLADTTGDGANCGFHGGNDMWVVKLSSTVDIKDITADKDIKLYPIPANEILQIDFHGGYEQAIVKLFNITGQEMHVPVINKQEKRILNLNGLTTGTYILQVFNDGEISTFRINHQAQ